jgi:DNA-binding XRE family transcriptional regulator
LTGATCSARSTPIQEAESFRSQLLRYRARTSLTQRNFAARVGVHPRSVQEWEAGTNYPPRSDCKRWLRPVAQAFARQLGGELLLVRAFELSQTELEYATVTAVDLGGDLDALSAEAKAYLQTVADRLRVEGLPTRWEVVRSPALAAVLETERCARPVLLVMASRGGKELADFISAA